MIRLPRRTLILSLVLVAFRTVTPARDGGPSSPLAPSAPSSSAGSDSCFLLYEVGVGPLRGDSSITCRRRVTPASTFKVPHALAALDAGVIAGPTETMSFDGAGQWPESSRHDHTLASAMRHSVVWYFQRIAQRLGSARERDYLERLSYGNMDASSGLTTFWLGGSLLVSPEEQQAFWLKLYQDDLPISARAVEQVKAMLVQPAGVVVNAAGEHPFAGPWPTGTIVSAKTGSATDPSGRGVRWLVGHVRRKDRSFVFVSCVVGPRDLDPSAAIDLASRSLQAAKVF